MAKRLLYPGPDRQKITIENMGPNSQPLIYVKITDEPVFQTKEYLPGVLIDLDDQGRLRGVELLNAEIVVRAIDLPRVPDVLPYQSGGAYRQGLLGTWAV